MGKLNFEIIKKTIDYVSTLPSKPVKTIYTACGGELSSTKESLIEFTTNPEPLTSIDRWHRKKEEELMEKMRMKNEMICKKQAIIDRLEHQNNLNEKEISELKETLKIINDELKKFDQV